LTTLSPTSFPISGIGIWSTSLRYGDPAVSADLAVELEEIGYSALWLPDIGGSDVFAAVENVLAATKAVSVATGVLNLWLHEAEETARQHARLVAAYGPRFLVGIGVSHAPLVAAREAGHYAKPLARTREYLDALDAAPVPLSPGTRVLAALGPKMRELARDRAAGVHPYLVTPENTASARAAVGPDRLVLPEQAVVLSTDPSQARAIARSHVADYVGLPNYENSWKRLGFTDEDIADGGSDRLIDGLVAWGDEAAIAARVKEHRDAGADHVCLQVLAEDKRLLPMDDCRRLASALLD
jgi:probable F420-dependent oxidoreductase